MCCCKPNGCRETGSLCSRPPLPFYSSTPGKFRGPPCKSLFGVHNLLLNLWVWKGEVGWLGPKLCKGGGEIFGDDAILESNFRFLPKYLGGSPPKWQFRARYGGHICWRSVLIFWVHLTGFCNQFGFIMHSHRVTFSSNFCVDVSFLVQRGVGSRPTSSSIWYKYFKIFSTKLILFDYKMNCASISSKLSGNVSRNEK